MSFYVATVHVERIDSPGDNPMHNDRKVYDLGEVTLRGKDLGELLARSVTSLELIQDWGPNAQLPTR